MLELYVTGSDDTSQKIFVTAGLAATMQSLGYSAGVYKPIETGTIKINGFAQPPDIAFVKFVDPYINTYYSYLLKIKAPPLLAAAAENITIEKNIILRDYQKIQDKNECLIIDGVSGLASPLNKDFLEEDMIKMLDIPLLMVISARTSKIDNVILSINHALETEIKLRGVILSNYPEKTEDINIKLMPRLIEEYTGADILGVLPAFDRNVNPNDLITEILNGVDVEGIFRMRIAKLQI